MIDHDQLRALLPGHLARQRWYDGDEAPTDIDVVEHEVWVDGDPALEWLLVEAADERGTARYQLFLGVRSGIEADFLHGKHRELLGTVATDDGDHIVYDAVIDADLAKEVMRRIVPTAHPELVRPLTVEQSNTSLVFDEAVIIKLFRRVHDGPNPDVEVIERLTDAGFTHVPAQVGVLRSEGRDLAVARAYLLGAVDGWHLALTSLRDLFAAKCDPAEAGGDFGPDAHRLGSITADMHLTLAGVYGTTAADPDAWRASFGRQLDAVRESVDADAIEAEYAALGTLGPTDAGPVQRIHGDFHLAQTLRAASGWYVIDFEGEPARPVAERTTPSSPLRDVAGMLRSFHYAAEIARRERVDHDPDLPALGSAWEDRARAHFLDGYLSTEGIESVLPPKRTRSTVLRGFELDKAVYEVAYELGFRPEWAPIPLGAIARLTGER